MDMANPTKIAVGEPYINKIYWEWIKVSCPWLKIKTKAFLKTFFLNSCLLRWNLISI